MGFVFRKRLRLSKGTALNLSKRGASASGKAGPIALNSPGRGSIRLGKGKSFRFKL